MGTRTRREKILRAGWRRLDFISSCRFDVPDACRWPASAFLTNSSPRRPLISALRPVPVPIFISLPLYGAGIFNHAQTEACVRVSVSTKRSLRIVAEYPKMAAVYTRSLWSRAAIKEICDVLYASNPIHSTGNAA